MKPVLSIILPTYNFVESLNDTIHSVTEQMTPEIELIIVDDGSDEEFKAALKTHENKYPNCIIKYCQHRGVSAARNEGLSLANGIYISFLDGDDYLYPGFIEGMLELIKHNTDLFILGFNYINIPENIDEIWSVPFHVFETVSDFADDYIRSMHPLLYTPCNKLYRNDIIRKHGIRFDEGVFFGEDRLFNFEFLRHSTAVITSDLVMFKYIIRGKKSASTKYIPFFFDINMELHKAKIDCFLSLSQGTSAQERHQFAMRDLAKEIEISVERFSSFPEEEQQCIEHINDIVFGKDCPSDKRRTWYLNKADRQKVYNEIKER